MDLRGLEAVIAVEEHGSFSAAAQALFISQPALTRRVALLERELDARLFLRTQRGVLLTDAGRALIGPARRALHETSSIRDALTSVRDGLHGSLSIVGTASLSRGILGFLISQFHEILPDVEIRVVSSDSSTAAAAAVESGENDIAVVELPLHSTLKVVPVLDEEFYAVFAGGGITGTVDTSIPLATKPMLDGRTMLHRPLTQYPKQRGNELWMQVGANPSGHLDIAECDLQLAVSRFGRAVAVVPRTIAMEARATGLDVAAPPQPIRRTVGLASLRSNTSPPVTALLDLARRIRPNASDPIALTSRPTRR